MTQADRIIVTAQATAEGLYESLRQPRAIGSFALGPRGAKAAAMAIIEKRAEWRASMGQCRPVFTGTIGGRQIPADMLDEMVEDARLPRFDGRGWAGRLATSISA